MNWENQPNDQPDYRHQSQSPNQSPRHIRSEGQPEIRKASIGFFDSFFEAKTFLGNDYWLFWGLCFVALFIGGIVPLIFYGPMYCGLGMCLLAKKRGQTPKFETLFKGFDYFMESLIPTLCYFAIVMVASVAYVVSILVAIAIGSIGEPWAFAIAGAIWLLSVALIIMVNIAFAMGAFFSSFLVAEYSIGGMEAFHISRRAMQENAGELIKMAIGGAILYIAAAMMCFIPALLMLPMFVVGHFVAYDKIFVSSGQPRRI